MQPLEQLHSPSISKLSSTHYPSVNSHFTWNLEIGHVFVPLFPMAMGSIWFDDPFKHPGFFRSPACWAASAACCTVSRNLHTNSDFLHVQDGFKVPAPVILQSCPAANILHRKMCTSYKLIYVDLSSKIFGLFSDDSWMIFG